MKSLIKIILFLWLPGAAQAQLRSSFYIPKQQEQFDSLQSALMNAANDTIRMELYNKLASYYEVIKRDSFLYFSQQQLIISQKLKLPLNEADALAAIGYVYRIYGNYPQSLNYALKALKIAENPESEKIARGLLKNETPRKARLTVLAYTHFSLGLLYGAIGNFNQQLLHYRQCEKLAAENKDNHRLASVNLSLGATYTQLNKLDSALDFELKALHYSTEDSSKRNMGRILNFTGIIYSRKKNYTVAKQYFTNAFQESQAQYNFQSLADACLNLADLYKSTGSRDSSLWYSKKGLEIFQSLGSPSGLLSAYSSLSSIYKESGNVDSAFMYLGLAMAAKDSLTNTQKIIQFQNIGFDEQIRLRDLEEDKVQIKNKIRTYSLFTGIAVFILIAFLLFRNNRNRKKANTLLQKQKAALQTTLQDLKTTQGQLIQSEKMASLGELTAGIAHEIQNPLNFVNNFSEVSVELVEEMKEELSKGNNQEAILIGDDLKDNLQKITEHGKRADAIVKGMLQHSRASTGKKELIDINALADEYLRLSYHGFRAKNKDFNTLLETHFDEHIGKIEVVPQDIGRVLLNLYNNAIYAVNEKKQQLNRAFIPTIEISTRRVEDKVEISVRDNGMGIPQKVVDKIFQPFFTTKPTGQGTGLGLSLSYDIIKAHSGEIKVETREGEGTTFTITLPANSSI